MSGCGEQFQRTFRARLLLWSVLTETVAPFRGNI